MVLSKFTMVESKTILAKSYPASSDGWNDSALNVMELVMVVLSLYYVAESHLDVVEVVEYDVDSVYWK